MFVCIYIYIYISCGHICVGVHEGGGKRDESDDKDSDVESTFKDPCVYLYEFTQRDRKNTVRGSGRATDHPKSAAPERIKKEGKTWYCKGQRVEAVRGLSEKEPGNERAGEGVKENKNKLTCSFLRR